jgi:hypothetical protein
VDLIIHLNIKHGRRNVQQICRAFAASRVNQEYTQ